MFSKKCFVTICIVILTALLATGCLFTTPVAVTGVTLNKATMALTAGEATGTLVATVAPTDATNKSVTWSSSAPAMVTVSVNGVVTPLTVGTATITVTTVDGGLTATCVVTVTPTPEVVPPAPAPVVPPTVVNLAAIPGITAPVTGATPVATITPTAQYTGTVSWSPADNPFKGEQVYTATITLTAKTGYTLTGVAADFFTVAEATPVNNLVNSGVVTAVFPETAAAVIDIAAIPGITAPVTGATPVTTITETAQYTGLVAWNTAPTTFAGATVYTAAITLTAKTGYTLMGVPHNFFTVAGATPVTNIANFGAVTAVFPATAAVIDLAAIPGVTAPVNGATPVDTITATAQYTGTVTWSPADNPFKGEQVYTATITLTAIAGYTLTGVAADFFTVADATPVTNLVNSGVVTAVFPETAAAVIDIAAISGVTAPVNGATPVATITPTAQYTGTVSWSGSPATFAGATVYTATITLTAKTGYTLTGVAADFFTVADATPVTNPVNSGVVTAVFPETVATPNLELTPPTQSVIVLSQVTINVEVKDVIDLISGLITLNFDATKLDYSSSALGGFFTSGVVDWDDEGVGWIALGFGSTSGAASSTGTIMTVTFDTLAPGSGTDTDITFGTTVLINTLNEDMIHTQGSGCSVTITAT